MNATTFARPMAALAIGLLSTASVAQEAAQPRAPRAFEKLTYPRLHDVKIPPVVRATLPSGIKLLLVEDHERPQISFHAIIRAGKVAEPAGKAGLAELFGETQRTGGTRSMTGDQLDELLDRLGASVESGVDEAQGTVSCTTLVEHVDKILPVFAEVVTAPAFAKDKIDLAKTHLRGMIARRNDDVQELAEREFFKLMYGARSPYARQFEYADIEALTRDDLLKYHAAYYRPDATVLAAWGDFKAPEMKAKLARTFASWKASGPAPVVKAPAAVAVAPSVNYIEKKDVEQTFLLLGQLGMRLDNPDYPATYVLSRVLGGGLASRIFVKVRTEKGLAYSAGGYMMPAYDHEGTFFFFTSTKPATTAEALSTVLDEIKKIREEVVKDNELRRAKDGYLNGYAFEYDSTAKIVNRLATYEFYGYPPDFNVKLRSAIEKVTKEDVLRVAQKHLDAKALTILAVGRAEQFDKPLSTFGKVVALDITIPEPKSQEATAPASAEATARGKKLLQKAARAMGEAALAALKDVTATGSLTVAAMGGMEVKSTTTFVLPDRFRNEMASSMGAMVQVIDGDGGWMKMGQNVRDLPGSMLAEARGGLYTEFGCALLLQDFLAGKVEAQALGLTDFEGGKAEDVLVKLGEKPVHLFLSTDSGLVVGTKRSAQTPQGPADVIELFSGQQAVSGLLVPFEKVEKVNGEVQSSTKLTEVKIDAGYSEELFKKPAPPAGN